MYKHSFILIILILLINTISCFKSSEQRIIDKEKAKQIIQDADKLYFDNKYNDALKEYLKVENLEFIPPLLYYKIGFCYDKGEENYKLAKEYYLKALKTLDVQNNLEYLSALYFNLGIIALHDNQESVKEENLNNSFSLLQKLQELGSLNGEDYFRLGYYYYDKKDYRNARKYFLLAIKYFRTQNSHHIYYAGAYFNIGITYWPDDVSTALWYWKYALTIDPQKELYQTWYQKAKQVKETTGG